MQLLRLICPWTLQNQRIIISFNIVFVIWIYYIDNFLFVEQTYTLNIPWHIGNLHPRHVQYTVHGIPEIQTLRLKRNDNININVPSCIMDQGFTICEYGNIQVSLLQSLLLVNVTLHHKPVMISRESRNLSTPPPKKSKR